MFDSKNGFQTKVWGPYAWFFLHTITLNFSPDRSKGYLAFFKSLGDVLPCGACRENYKRIISSDDRKLHLDSQKMKSRSRVSRWLFRVHIQVQQDIYDKTKRKKDLPVYKDTKEDFILAMKEYEQYRASCQKRSYGCVKPKKGYKKCHSIIRITPNKHLL